MNTIDSEVSSENEYMGQIMGTHLALLYKFDEVENVEKDSNLEKEIYDYLMNDELCGEKKTLRGRREGGEASAPAFASSRVKRIR